MKRFTPKIVSSGSQIVMIIVVFSTLKDFPDVELVKTWTFRGVYRPGVIGEKFFGR